MPNIYGEEQKELVWLGSGLGRRLGGVTSATSPVITAGTTLNIPEPAGSIVGDTLVLLVATEGVSVLPPVSTGFTVDTALANADANSAIFVMAGVAVGDGLGIAVTLPLPLNAVGVAVRVPNINAADPFGAVGALAGQAVGLTLEIPSVTTVSDDNLVLAVTASVPGNGNGTNITRPFDTVAQTPPGVGIGLTVQGKRQSGQKQVGPSSLVNVGASRKQLGLMVSLNL